MDIKNRLRILIVGSVGIVTLFFFIGLAYMNIRISSNQKDIIEKMNSTIDEDVKNQLFDLGQNISSYEISIEEEVDRNMLNAANTVKEADEKSGYNLSSQDVEKIKQETEMSDIYLTTPDGTFTNQTTEKNGIGLSLYDIWDGYKMLMTGESSYLPSSLKIKEETGDIFKFTAIPRSGGKGIIESALDSSRMQDNMQSFLTEKNGVKAMYLVDPSGLVLTENLYSGYDSVLKKGTTINVDNINDILNGTVDKNIIMDDNKAEVYMPIKSNGSIKYAMYLVVDTTSYYDMEEVISKPLNALQKNIISVTIIVIILVLASVIVSIILSSTLASKLLQPLAYLKKTLNDLAEGKEVATTKNIGTSDFNELNDSLNRLVHRYTSIINNIRNNAGKVKELQDEYTNKIHEMVETSNKVNDNMSDNVERVERQNSDVQDITEILNKLLVTINEINDETNNLSGKTRESNDIANSGVKSLDEMTKSFDVIRGEIEESSGIISRLSESSSKIADITNIIKDISDQTNLLSLNASIEAARVGEQGKGFLVVANEIKELASQSSEATNTIASLVSEILKNISDTENSNENQINSINNSKAMMDSTKKAISNMITLTVDITDMIQKLSQEVKDVYNSSSIVSDGMMTLKEYSEENTETSKASQNSINIIVGSLNELENSLNEISRSIQELSSNM